MIMIDKIKLTLFVLTFIFATMFADTPGYQKDSAAYEKDNSSAYKLNISLFSGLVNMKGPWKGLKNDELILLGCKPFNGKRELENYLSSLSEMGLANIALKRFAHSESIPNAHEFEKVNWMKDEIMMNVSLSESAGVFLPVTGKVSFFDTNDKSTHEKIFSLKKDECVAAMFKKRENLIVLAIQLKCSEQEIYCTEYRSEKFTVNCADHKWSDVQIKADTIVFHKAKAIIPIKDGSLLLKGETMAYFKKDETLIADNGSLTLPDGTMYSTRGKITIPLNNPLEFKID